MNETCRVGMPKKAMTPQRLNPTYYRKKTSFRLSIPKYLPLLLAVLIIYSICAVALHCHEDLKSRVDCAICKFADDLSSGDNAAPHLPAIAYIAHSFCLEASIWFLAMPTAAVAGRAPPVFVPS